MTIRSRISVQYPKKELSRINFVPFYIYFSDLFRLTDSILQNSDFLGSC